MTTNLNIMRIGNSCGVIIPSSVMKSLSLSVRDKLRLTEANGKIILQKQSAGDVETPFFALDEWCRERGYEGESVRTALDYVSDIRSARRDKDIPQW
jgi:antitoxin component of MazEF toxin-antitoxin module